MKLFLNPTEAGALASLLQRGDGVCDCEIVILIAPDKKAGIEIHIGDIMAVIALQTRAEV